MTSVEEAFKTFECIKHGAVDCILKPITWADIKFFWQHILKRGLSDLIGHESPKEIISQNAKCESTSTETPETCKNKIREMREYFEIQIRKYQRLIDLLNTSERDKGIG